MTVNKIIAVEAKEDIFEVENPENGNAATIEIEKQKDLPAMTHGALIESCIGAFHRWQLMVCLAVFFVNFPLVWHEMVNMIFSPTLQKFRCVDNETDPCTAECKSIVFEPHEIRWTIKEQWMLICDLDWLGSFSQTLLMFGVLVGNIAFGLLSDRFGRRKPLLAAVCIQVVASIGMAFSPWFWLFIVGRFLVGISTGGTQLIAFCIVMEVVGRQYRSTLGVLFQLLYYVGHAMLGVIGYFLRDWQHVQLAISVPSLILLSYFFILPESPRWLLTVQRLDEAIDVLEKGAKCNKLPTEHIRNTIQSKLGTHEQHYGNILDLMRTSNMRIKTICICINWVVLGVSFFGIAHYMGQIGGNMFINMVVTGLVQIPGNSFIIPLMAKFGRKYTLMGTYIFCALSVFLIPVIPKEPHWPVTVLGCLGMVGVSLAFATMFVFSGELYPTVIRNAGMGVSSVFAKLGAMVAPYINTLEHVHFCIPPVIYGIGPVIATIVCLRLPETLDTTIPDTMEEAEEFGKKTA